MLGSHIPVIRTYTDNSMTRSSDAGNANPSDDLGTASSCRRRECLRCPIRIRLTGVWLPHGDADVISSDAWLDLPDVPWLEKACIDADCPMHLNIGRSHLTIRAWVQNQEPALAKPTIATDFVNEPLKDNPGLQRNAG
jgi:hypothetical protein